MTEDNDIPYKNVTLWKAVQKVTFVDEYTKQHFVLYITKQYDKDVTTYSIDDKVLFSIDNNGKRI